MSENTAMVPAQAGGLVLRPQMRPAALMEQHDEVLAWVREALVAGRDYTTLPGTDGRFLTKEGMEKVALGFGLEVRVDLVENEADHDRQTRFVKRQKVWFDDGGRRSFRWEEEEGWSLGLYRYVVRAQLINRATGECVGSGLGAASSLEARFVAQPREAENSILDAAVRRATRNALKSTLGLSGMFSDLDAPEDDTPARQQQPASRGRSNGNAGSSRGNSGSRSNGNGRAGGDGFTLPKDLKMMASRRDGRCAHPRCGAELRAGDTIGWGDGKAFCEECATAINHGHDPFAQPAAPSAPAPPAEDDVWGESPPEEPPHGGAAPDDDSDPFADGGER